MAAPGIPSRPPIPDNVDGTSGSGTWDNGTLGSGTWSYDATTQILTISGTGVTPDYSSAKPPWYGLLPNPDYSSLRVTAIVENGITGLGEYTFSTNPIESITLSNGLKTIGVSCFESVMDLSEIVLPSSVNYIGAYAFSRCRGLVNIYFKSTSAPTMGTNAFVLPMGGTHIANVYTVGWGSDSVFTESIRNDTTPSMNVMKRYTNFTYYIWSPLPGGSCGDNAKWEFDPDTGTLRIFGTGATWEFSRNGSSEPGVEELPWINYCNEITTLVIEEGITGIGTYAFNNILAPNLRSVILPEGLVEIGSGAFMDSPITSIVLPELLTRIGGSAFSGSALTSITLPSTLEFIGTSAFSHSGIESLTVSDGVESVSGFDLMTNLKSVTLPSTLTTIEYMAFEKCTSLESIIIPENVMSIDNKAFAYCRNLTEITFLGSQPTLGRMSFCLGDYSSNPVTATVYTNGWGSDDVFTTDIRRDGKYGVYTTFIYETLGSGGSAVTIPVNVNGSWVDAVPYVNVNGEWKEVTVYMNVNGTWKETV